MDITLKVSLFLFWLNAATGQFLTKSVDDPEEMSRQFYIDQNKQTQELLKSELDLFSSTLLKALIGEMTRINSETSSKLETLNEKLVKIERNQKKLSANLSRKLIENIGQLSFNLSESFKERLSTAELKVERSLQNLSESFGGSLRSSGWKMAEELGDLNETTRSNSNDLTNSFAILSESLNPNQMTKDSTTLPIVENPTESTPTTQPYTQTEVEEVDFGKSGTIEFAGGTNSNLGRKIWILQPEGDSFYSQVDFKLKDNRLGGDARLFLWGSGWGGQHLWNGSQSDWRKPKRISGNVILVTLTIPSSSTQQPSFKLTFNTSRSENVFVCTSELIRKEGRHVVSFPPNNVQEYPPRSLFTAVIAPPSGKSFGLTLKYLDLPGSPPHYCDNYFNLYFLEENQGELYYRKLSDFRQCGSLGNISQPDGTTNVAIVQFYSPSGGKGGFRIEVNLN